MSDQGEPRPENSRAGLFGRRVALQTPKEALQPEQAPPPPEVRKKRKRSPLLSTLSGIVTFIVLLAIGLVALGSYARQQMRAPGPLDTDKVVMIPPRAPVSESLDLLEREGVISNALIMNFALILGGKRSEVKAGEYLFKAHASIADVVETLVSGREIMHSITIPEGLTSEQIIQRLRDTDLLSGDVREMPKEGSLLPETYRVARGMSRGDLIRKMQDDQKKALDQIWARRSPDLPLRSPFEMLILASIVEKETGKSDERPRVAGVFINRLQKRMKLQSDPTIVYGLVGGRGTLGRGILRSEVDKPTPYNTYAIEGLPPGPIANPGRAALEAVANPSRTKELYFVADGTGGHVFAETLDQHNKNVLRWRQIEKDRAAAAAATAGAPAVAPSVDHVLPDSTPAAAAPRDQRGEIAPPAYGSLSPAFGLTPPTPLSGLAYAATPATDAPAVDAIETAQRVARPPAATINNQTKPPAPDKFKFGGEIDQSIAAQLGLGGEALDGPAEDASAGDGGALASFPVSPQRLAEQRARAARYGYVLSDDSAPPAAEDRGGLTNPPSGPRVVKIYDASEGTPLDPLKDRTWDLNSPKTVPVMAPDPSTTLPAARKKPPAPRKQAASKPKPVVQ